MIRAVITCLASTVLMAQGPPTARQVSDFGIRHGVLAFGADTFMVDAAGNTVWTYPRNTRDGWALPNNRFLLAITRCAEYPSGGIVEIDRAGTVSFEYKGSQSEVDTCQPLPDEHILLTESGPKPRVLEIDRRGKTLLEFPLQCQTRDFHMQTRMVRKLKNGHYLAPHLLDLAVKEYDKTGKVVWEAKTPDWPFAAVRLENGNTLITCTRGLKVIEVDREGKTVWELSNADLPEPLIKDACGAQRLPNGNTVITSYGANSPEDVKLFEVNRDKQVVWKFYSGRNHGIHEFQILNESLKPLPGRQLR